MPRVYSSKGILYLSVMALLGLLSTGRESSAQATETRPPNIIYIFTDDQRWDALSIVQREQGERARFPWLKTPNLDRLAQEGIRFRNAFVVNSLCAPSRATLVTGQYGHVNGVVNNHTPHPETNISVARLLSGAGYSTAYIGKWHHGMQSGKRPGFDYSASFVGQGKYFDCPVEVNGIATPTKGFIDDVTTDYASSFIREHQDKPFLLILGYKTCHGPFTPPPRHETTYEGELAGRVPNLNAHAPYRPNNAAATANRAAQNQTTRQKKSLPTWVCFEASPQSMITWANCWSYSTSLN